MGGVAGIFAALLYCRLSSSSDKAFHAFIILGAFGFTAPMFTVSVRLMVKMYYMSYEAVAEQNELFTEIEPLLSDVKVGVRDAKEIIEEVRREDLNKITEVLTRMAKGDALERAFEAIGELPGKIDQLIDREGAGGSKVTDKDEWRRRVAAGDGK